MLPSLPVHIPAYQPPRGNSIFNKMLATQLILSLLWFIGVILHYKMHFLPGGIVPVEDVLISIGLWSMAGFLAAFALSQGVFHRALKKDTIYRTDYEKDYLKQLAGMHPEILLKSLISLDVDKLTRNRIQCELLARAQKVAA